MTELDDLLAYIFDGKKPALYREFAGWVGGSRRFRAFAGEYRGKIRAKLRNARDWDGMRDLRAELETATLLLRDERFTVAYEKYAASKGGGPDFTVTFRTHILFNVEVRHIRGAELDEGEAEAQTGKLVEVLCDKVRQMPPGIVNLLWLAPERELPAGDLTRAATVVRELAEHKVEAFFVRRSYPSAAGFLRQYGQLSGVVLHEAGENTLWLNPLARHKTPPEIVTAIQRLKAM